VLRQRRREDASITARPQRLTRAVLNGLHLDSSLLNNKVPDEPKVYQKNEKKNGKNRAYHRYQYRKSYHYEDVIGNASDPEVVIGHAKASPTGHHLRKAVAQSVSSRASIEQRKVDSRLRGADLYVARLVLKPKQMDVTPQLVFASDLDSLNSGMSSLSTNACERPSTGSLHEELSCLLPGPLTSSPSVVEADPLAPVPKAVSSHPCYRCVSYMHAAGIRRVFWTNNDGQWESGKVRDLMDLLQDGDDATTNVYVSKHEVLMLRRQMGGSCRGRGGSLRGSFALARGGKRCQ
jgi:hypothetical protein